MIRLTVFLIAAASSAALAAPAPVDAQLADRDPPRWSEPIVTPAQRLESSLKESRNALADAIKECRASSERKACEAEARAQYQREVAAAKQQAANRAR